MRLFSSPKRQKLPSTTNENPTFRFSCKISYLHQHAIHASEDQIQSFFHKLSKDKCKSFVLPVTEPFSKEFACLFSGQECYKEAIAESFLNGRVTPQMVINLTQLTHGKSRMWIGTRPVKSQLLGLDRFFTLIPINHCYPCLKLAICYPESYRFSTQAATSCMGLQT